MEAAVNSPASRTPLAFDGGVEEPEQLHYE